MKRVLVPVRENRGKIRKAYSRKQNINGRPGGFE
jgi:hypothetical protein